MKLSEKQVAQQIVSYLTALGWTCVRQQSGLFQRPGSSARIRIGEVGASDWYAYRPLPCLSGCQSRTVEFFFFETKAYGKTPSDDQAAWRNGRLRAGVGAGWFDNFEDFEIEYAKNYGRRAGDLAGQGL